MHAPERAYTKVQLTGWGDYGISGVVLLAMPAFRIPILFADSFSLTHVPPFVLIMTVAVVVILLSRMLSSSR